MLVGLQQYMRKIPIDHPDEVLFVQNVNHTYSLTAFDYSYHSKKIFWCDIERQIVLKSSVEDGNTREIIRDFAHYTTVNGLAVDWVYKHIYYTQCLVNEIWLLWFV